MITYLFVIVGVGGTGSLLARDLPKLLIDTQHSMMIIDGDHVEEKNMKRQSYQKHDIGENKAIALAAKINSFYETKCQAFDRYITKDELKSWIFENGNYSNKWRVPVIIGCVDNDKTRMLLEDTFRDIDSVIYLDSANSEYEGNVYITVKSNNVQKGKLRSQVYDLANDAHPLDKSCQELAGRNTQFLITNVKMAAVLLEHINSLLQKQMKVGVTLVKRFETIHS